MNFLRIQKSIKQTFASRKPISLDLAVAMARSKHLGAKYVAGHRKRRKAQQQSESESNGGEPSRRRRRIASVEESIPTGATSGASVEEALSRERRRSDGAVEAGRSVPETDSDTADGVSGQHSGQAGEASEADASAGAPGTARETQEGPSAETGKKSPLCLWNTSVLLQLT